MSKLISNLPIVVLAFGILTLANAIGCSGDDFSLAPVSGIAIANGKPVEGIEVVFYPIPTKENATPGPFAAGKTDSEGKFSLVSRNGRAGAVVGSCRVGFELPGASRSSLEGAQSSLRELNADRDQEAIKIVKERIATIKRTMEQFSIVDPKFLKSRSLQVTVPPEGLTDFEIDVSKK